MTRLVVSRGVPFVSLDVAICALIVGVLIGVWIMAMLIDHDERVAARNAMEARVKGAFKTSLQGVLDADMQRDMMRSVMREEHAKVAAIRRASSRETMEGGHR